MKKPLPGAASCRRPEAGALLDLRFLEDDVLASDRIVFLQLELLGLGSRVLLGDVIKPGVGRADELDENGIGLRHDGYPMRKIAGLRRTITVLTRLSSKRPHSACVEVRGRRLIRS